MANDTIKTEPVDVIPTSSLTTNTISSIANTSAISGGNINATTDDVVIARGVVWSTTSSPTIDLSTKTVDGSGSGTFTSSITGLSLGTLYYVRAYATNSNGTDYGPQQSFTSLKAPTVAATSAASSITYYNAIIGGNITADNGVAITARGFVYALASITTNPTLSNSFVTIAGTTGSFTGTITGLAPSSTYYVSTYATNGQGTTYGSPINLTTPTAAVGSGLTSGTAATSALAILTGFPSSPDGVYWINIPSVGVQQVYCLMNSKYDGGGWMLAMKAAETGNTFGYASSYWTSSTNNLNTASPSRLATNNIDAKYDVMNYYASGNDLMALWPDVANSPSANGSTTNSGSISGLTEWSWLAKSVLGGNTTMQAKLNSTQTSLVTNPSGVASGSGTSTVYNFTGFGAGTYNPFSSQGGFNFYGFNYTGNSSHSARWGFGWNNEGDQGSNDVSGGIGLNQSAISAGDINTVNWSNINGFNRQMKVEIYVR